MTESDSRWNGWQSVVGNDMFHFFKDGVSLCGRYEESRIERAVRGMGEKASCKNCEKARKNRGL